MLLAVAGQRLALSGVSPGPAEAALTMPGGRARRIAIVGVREELALPALPGDLQVDIGTSDVTG
jgi:hypothetical protein